MKTLIDLFLIFFRIGMVSFGGGYAMLPILQREFVDDRKWVTTEELADYFAIGQCTPGVIAVNTATFIGYKRKGTVGGIVATLGMVMPSIIIITVIAGFISNFADLEIVKNAFAGIRACVCVLILNAVIKLWKGAIVSKISIIIFVIVFLISVFTSISSIILVVAAGVAGIVINAIHKEASK